MAATGFPSLPPTPFVHCESGLRGASLGPVFSLSGPEQYGHSSLSLKTSNLEKEVFHEKGKNSSCLYNVRF